MKPNFSSIQAIMQEVKKQLPNEEILSPAELLKIKGGTGSNTPPVDPNDVVIEDIIIN